MDIKVLYEDNHLLVVVKPPDIPVQGDISGALDLLSLLKEEIKKRYQKPGNVFLGLVHRLDRPVGGVMVFARTSKAASRLSALIRERGMDKTYLCVVKGCPREKTGRLSDYLLKNTQNNTVRVVKPGTPQAKEAILEYEVLNTLQDMSLVRIRLLTGRSHQIRVQMSHQGTPLLGDLKYGYQGEYGGSPALWSYSLSIEHPTKKERMHFASPPPEQFPWNLFDELIHTL